MTVRLLTLVRHAEAGAEHGSRLRDCDRPLTERGQADAHRLGTRLAAIDFAPDRVWTSDTARALTTARVLEQSLSLEHAGLDIRSSLSLAHASVLCELLREADDEIHHLMLVGHNPGLSEVWNWLCDKSGFGLPTCGVARLKLDIRHWNQLDRGCARLIEFERPGSTISPSG